MSVMSSPARQKSWQIADRIGTLLDAVDLDKEQFTSRLRALARSRGLDSDEDAARLIGVSYRQYQRWLSGDSTPRGSSLKQIAGAYEIPLAQLLGEPSKSQLDRIEAKLDALLNGAVDQQEEDEGGAAAALLMTAESRVPPAPAPRPSRPAARRRRSA